jgi:predicted GH43/DUF377 family glycosyl hydrolase
MNALHEQAIKALHQGEFDKVKNIVLKNIPRQVGGVQPEALALGQLILIDSYIAQAKHDDAREALERLLISPILQDNQELKSKAFKVLHYYISWLHPKIVDIIPWTTIAPFNYMNASLLLVDNKKLISFIRATNYEKPSRQEKRHDPWNRIVSRCFVHHYDPYFRTLFHKEMQDLSIFPRNISPVVGYEDPRIVYYKNELYFTATSFETQRVSKASIVLCKVNEEWDIVSTIPLHCQDPNQMQKNWLPFVDKDRLLVVYKMSPFIINEINPITGEFTEIVNIPLPNVHFPTLRGSTSPVAYKNGYLFCVHFVNYAHPDEDAYYTKFVWLDASLCPQKISGTFLLEHIGLEYISGLAIWDTSVYIAYNLHDTTSRLARITVDVLNEKIPWYEITTGKLSQL